jgi:hypothetical protein
LKIFLFLFFSILILEAKTPPYNDNGFVNFFSSQVVEKHCKYISYGSGENVEAGRGYSYGFLHGLLSGMEKDKRTKLNFESTIKSSCIRALNNPDTVLFLQKFQYGVYETISKSK